MTQAQSAADPKEQYLTAFEALLEQEQSEGRDQDWIVSMRTQAIERFRELGFPTMRDEGWRQTNLSPLTSLETNRAPVGQIEDVTQAFEQFSLEGLNGPRLVWVNGQFVAGLSRIGVLPPGVVLGSMAQAIEEGEPAARAHLGQHAAYEKNAFTALNTAFWQDGAFLHVPNGAIVEAPIHLLFLTTSLARRGDATAPATVAHPRNLLVFGDNAQATVIEHYGGVLGDVYLNNAVTEVVVGSGANVDHYKVQQESEDGFHLATMQVSQEQDANFASLNIAFGARLSRSHANATMGAPGVECTLNGLYLMRGEQQVDNETVMDHAAPHCNSHEVYTGILDGKAKGVFNGKIFVRQIAQKTDAKQTNRNLLLSPDAMIDTKPQLEIFADDVKCTHGATIGQLDEDAIFYLRARGIGHSEARAMLILAFASAVTEQVRVEPLRQMLDRELSSRLLRS